MSETIRDQALRATLSILDNHKQIAFVRYRHLSGSETKIYHAKVTKLQVEQILKLQQQIVLSKLEKESNPKPVGTTLDDLLAGETKTKIGEYQPETDMCNLKRVYGLMPSVNGVGLVIPQPVEIIELFGYSQLAGIDFPLENLKYLLGVVDTEDFKQAKASEHKLVNTITNKLQAQFTESYALNLLGQDTYQEVINTIDKPKDTV